MISSLKIWPHFPPFASGLTTKPYLEAFMTCEGVGFVESKEFLLMTGISVEKMSLVLDSGEINGAGVPKELSALEKILVARFFYFGVI
jgi:hypothetical protein